MSKKSKVSSAKKSTKKSASVVKKTVVKKTAVKKSKNNAKKTPAKKIVKKIIAKKPLKKSTAKASPKKIVKKSSPKKPIAKKVVKPVKKVKAVAKSVVKAAPAKATLKLKKDVQSVKTKATPKPAKEIKPALAKKNFVLEKPAPKKESVKPVEKPKPSESETKSASSKVLAITNTIPKNEVPEISPLKIASITSSITNPMKKTDSYSVKMEKEPAGKFELEFVVRSSPEMLFEFLSAPSGLSEWFCDDVNIRNGIYTFIWDGQLQQARLLKTVDDHLVRFQWVEKTDGSYFEFKIQKDDLTNDISLIVTDFADNASERESSRLLWQSQVEKLMHIIGSIF
jgi:uncharacterized protein YndB with AHSA1/START domain